MHGIMHVLMPKKDLFTLSLQMGEETFESSGTTAREAIESFKGPSYISDTKGLLTFTKNDEKKEMIITPIQIKRISMKVTRLFLLKNFMFGLK